MTDRIAIDRRAFIAGVAASGGFLLGWRIPLGAPATAVAAQAPTAHEVGVWVAIDPDDTVTVRIARAEMGQGTLTGLAQLVAEELECDWNHVRADFVSPEENLARGNAWGEMATGGSRGIRASQDYVRRGGAAARIMLVAAAAQRWSVPASECRAALGVVTHTSTGRSLRYGELAADAARLPVPEAVPLKPVSAWTIAGKGLPRLDTAPKLDGSLTYAIDVRLPGMLSAAIAQCPVFGGTVKSFDAAAVASLPGVRKVLAVGNDAVAVVADTWYQARGALDKLPIVWDEGPDTAASSDSIAANVATGLTAAEAAVGNEHGDVATALKGAAKTVDATYGTPFVSHATLEPMNCTARVAEGGVEVWVSSQNAAASLTAAAAAAGVPAAKARVHVHTLGGGFGRRSIQDVTRQAVLIARAMDGQPVKLIWSREQDMQHDFYRPVAQCRLVGGLDDKGEVIALHARIAAQSILATRAPGAVRGGADPSAFQGWGPGEFGYMAIPNLRLDYAMRNSHVPVGAWRGVNTNQNTIFMECFIDELAHAAGRDPLEFRLALLAKAPHQRAVLETAATKAGWHDQPPPGIFRGLAQNYGFGSYTAAVSEVSVSEGGQLRIHRIVAAIDPGIAVNPQQIAMQVEGAFAYGLSALLTSEITIKDGRVVEGNFDRYGVVRMAQMPAVEVHVVPSGGFWGGVGEPGIAVAAPSVLNAIFAATGKRIRTLPLSHHDLSRA
jgi:isoquinoline 1-oxidoreductase beta subunit